MSETASSETPPSEPAGPVSGPDAPVGDAPAPALSRVREGRILGGVAAGLARRFKVEPAIVRVGFILASVAWGLGVLVYLALWILLPLEEAAPSPRRARRLLILLGASLVIVAAATRAQHPGVPHVLVVVVLITLVIALFDEARHPIGVARTFLRALSALLGAGVALVLLAGVLVVAAGPLSGIPLGGGVGQRVVHLSGRGSPSAIRLLAGSLEIDLGALGPASRLSLSASVDVGQLSVRVPAGTRVVLDARTGIGGVFLQPGLNAGLGLSAPTLYLHLGVGVGQVRVTR